MAYPLGYSWLAITIKRHHCSCESSGSVVEKRWCFVTWFASPDVRSPTHCPAQIIKDGRSSSHIVDPDIQRREHASLKTVMHANARVSPLRRSLRHTADQCRLSVRKWRRYNLVQSNRKAYAWQSITLSQTFYKQFLQSLRLMITQQPFQNWVAQTRTFLCICQRRIRKTIREGR